MAYWPKLQEVRSLLRLQPDNTEDGIITTALAAAIDYGNRRLNYRYPVPPFDDGTLPDAAHEACLLHAARLYRRRDSVDGTIAWGDMGVMRVGRGDPDVDAMYAVCGPLVFG
jgi:Phage gp6-like head-tail connector protein